MSINSATGDFEKVEDAELDYNHKPSIVHKRQIERQLDLEIKLFEQDIGQRAKFANHLFRLVVSWLTLIAIILLMCGFRVLLLSDAVILALIGATTANVLGLFTIVASYIFPRTNGSGLFKSVRSRKE